MSTKQAIIQGPSGKAAIVPANAQAMVISQTGPGGPPGTPAAQEIIGVRQGPLPASPILFWYEFGVDTTIDMVASRMRVGRAPVGNVSCPITSNGLPVGTWFVGAGLIQGVLSLTQVDYAALADFQVLGPALPDAQMTDTLIIMALES